MGLEVNFTEIYDVKIDISSLYKIISNILYMIDIYGEGKQTYYAVFL